MHVSGRCLRNSPISLTARSNFMSPPFCPGLPMRAAQKNPFVAHLWSKDFPDECLFCLAFTYNINFITHEQGLRLQCSFARVRPMNILPANVIALLHLIF